MSLDITECLKGLQEANSCTPTNSPPDSPRRKNELLEADVESDADTVRRISMVEERLLELLKHDEEIDEEEARAIARRCSVLSKAKELPVMHPHSCK